MRIKNQETFLKFRFYLFVVSIIAAAIFSGIFLLFSNKITPISHAQQDPFLAQRLNQLEQRFTTIETRLNRLESESRIPSIAPRTTENNDLELQLLRSQIESLQLQLTQVECALLKLDERTLPTAVRQARKKVDAGRTIERCRQNPNELIQLPIQP